MIFFFILWKCKISCCLPVLAGRELALCTKRCEFQQAEVMVNWLFMTSPDFWSDLLSRIKSIHTFSRGKSSLSMQSNNIGIQLKYGNKSNNFRIIINSTLPQKLLFSSFVFALGNIHSNSQELPLALYPVTMQLGWLWDARYWA